MLANGVKAQATDVLYLTYILAHLMKWNSVVFEKAYLRQWKPGIRQWSNDRNA